MHTGSGKSFSLEQIPSFEKVIAIKETTLASKLTVEYALANDIKVKKCRNLSGCEKNQCFYVP